MPIPERYAGAVRGHGWHFLTRLKHSRRVNPDSTANGGTEHWASSGVTMGAATRVGLARMEAAIENSRRQWCHILLSSRASGRLEAHRLRTGIGGYAARADIIREAIRLYLRKPSMTLETIA